MSTPSPAPHSKRRLVPDPSDTIEVGGERLVRVERVAREDPRSIDDVAKKHLSREVVEVAEQHPEFMQAMAEAEGTALPSPQDLAGRIELFAEGDGAVPHPEPDVQKRVGMTVSPVIATEDAPPDFVSAASPPQTLVDLFSRFPGLDGVNQYIYVERKDPKLFSGRKVAGVMRPITGPLSFADWQQIYGGGTYKLIVYGPPPRGGVMDADGRVRPKALTEPLMVTFPGIPSSEGEVYDDEADMTQSTQGYITGGRRGPASMADASVAKIETEAQLTREERQENKEKAQRDREEQQRKEREREQNSIAKQLAEMGQAQAEAQADFRREVLELQRQHQQDMAAQRKEYEEKLAAKKPERDQLETALLLSKNLHGDNQGSAEALTALRAEHAREIDRLSRQSKEDHDRAEQRVKDERDRSDKLVKEAESRADARIKESEARTAQLERDLRDRTDREVQRAKEEADRRVNDLQHQHATTTAAEARSHEVAMAAEIRNHERDMSSLKAQHQMATESLKASYEMQLSVARGEVKRTAADVERYKQDAEENKDVVGRITQVKETAVALGMVDASEAIGAEPETIGQMLMKMGGGLLQNLPGVIESVSAMVKQRSAAEVQAARLQGRQDMIEQAGAGLGAPALPPAHRRRAIDGGGGFVPRHMSEVGSAPINHGGDPFVVAPQPQYVQPFTPAHPAPAPAPMQQPPRPVMQPEPQYHEPAPQVHQLAQAPSLPPTSPPAQSAPPPPPAAPPAPASIPPGVDAAVLKEDQEILQAESMLRPPYEGQVPVPALADGIMQQWGPEVVANLVGTIDAERVVLAIQRSGDPNSPFLRRDGKKYLRALFDELKKKLK